MMAMLTAMAVSVSAFADDYGYMTFQKTDGKLVSVSAASLSMTFRDGKLTVTNGTESRTFSLSELSKMYFSSDDATDIDNAPAAVNDSRMEVFSVQGVSLGEFDSVEAARKSLPSGAYIVKTNGRTFKIAVK